MNNPVSIILPAYNAEPTITRAIKSVINQTHSDWELIIVDDGSTDNTGRICTEFAATDSRIKLIKQPNSGVAIARQTGLSSATGSYVIHLDSDDYMEPVMLEKMVNLIKRTNADIVVCDFNEVSPDNSTKLRDQSHAFSAGETTGGEFMWSILNGVSFGALWNKLIKRSLFCSSSDYFYQGINYSEDVLALSQILYGSNYKIVHLPIAVYNYSVNQESLTRKWTNTTFNSLCRYYDKISDILPDDTQSCEFKAGLKMGRFSAGFLYGIFTNEEIPHEFAKVRKQAYSTKSLRWKFGYIMIDLRCYSLARHLLAQ